MVFIIKMKQKRAQKGHINNKTKQQHDLAFFLNYAARVITTVAVIGLC